MIAVVAGSTMLATPAAAAPAAVPAKAPELGGIDLPCVLPAGLCKDIKDTGNKVIDKTIDGAKWVCDKAKTVCEVAGDAVDGAVSSVSDAAGAVSDTIDFASDPLGYLAKKSTPSIGKLIEAIATDGT
ncbi:hypothetical protein ACWKT5_11330 [Streptomyces avermitilis]